MHQLKKKVKLWMLLNLRVSNMVMVVGDLQDLQGILPGILHAQLTDTVEKRETPTLKLWLLLNLRKLILRASNMEAMVDIDLQGLTMDIDPDQLTADTEEKREKPNLKI